jgi:hypothetical protein
MGHGSEIEDGMGFAGLVPSAAERAREREIRAAVTTAKRDLAEKVLAAIGKVSPTKEHGEMRDPWAVKTSIELAVRSVLTDAGIKLTTTQQQEGE